MRGPVQALGVSAAIAIMLSSAAVAQGGRAPSPDGSAATEIRGKYVGNPDEPVY